jgi:hypothetical protein
MIGVVDSKCGTGNFTTGVSRRPPKIEREPGLTIEEVQFGLRARQAYPPSTYLCSRTPRTPAKLLYNHPVVSARGANVY